MNERTSLVTGATGGIGRAVAVRLATHGDRVLAVGRDHVQGARVVQTLASVGIRRDHAHLPADLSLMSDTARLAEEVIARTPRLDSIVLCAGVFSARAEWTTEGLERTFALNYLSRFLLVSRLLPLLTTSPAGRLVIVASAGQYRDHLDLDAVRDGRSHPRRHLAAASQFANDLLVMELSSRLTGTNVEVTCVHPGLARTDVFRNARGVPAPVRWIALVVQRLVGSSADDAAMTPARLALDAPARSSGRFFDPALQPIPVPDRASDPRRRKELWETSQELVRPWLDTPATEVAS